MLPERIRLPCGTKAKSPREEESIGVSPSRVRVPLVASKRPKSNLNSVLFPQPDLPVNAVISFLFAINEQFLRACSSKYELCI